MAGEYRIPAPRQRVWEALNDPEILKAAIPGCEQLEKISDEEMTARVKAKVGPVSATFFGKVTLGDLNPPESYTISGEGSGGVAGFAKGGAKVSLADDGAGTLLTYAAKADVGGKLAQIGSRLVQGTAKKMADDFFGRFSRLVAERHGAEGAAAPAAAVGPAAALGTPPPVVAPPDVAAAIPPTMNVEATAGGVPPFVPPDDVAMPASDFGPRAADIGTPANESAPPQPAFRAGGTAAREASEAARGASTVPQASAEAGLLQRPLTWVGIAVLVLALLFLIL
jgi:carbon monoxide dehydrogenase subunit G